ncbi:MAG: methyltransferase domain-containing protein [Candidatus Kapabacteria bacterium]|nr:methyltransferase domain-containing protein [Candidatus Kapabacteria bacterium]
MALIEIENRYTSLAESTCCLSCGGAINYADIKNGEICVDLGSGRGNDVLRMAEEAGQNGFAYGIDISDGMLEKARKTAEKFEVQNVRFIKSELESIQLPENTADVVISNCTINHARDKQEVWNEIYRIMKNNGRFVVSDIYSLETVSEEYRDDPVAVAECWAGSVTRSEYMLQLQNAGFDRIAILEESIPYSKGKIEVISFTIAGFKKS